MKQIFLLRKLSLHGFGYSAENLKGRKIETLEEIFESLEVISSRRDLQIQQQSKSLRKKSLKSEGGTKNSNNLSLNWNFILFANLKKDI